MKHALHIHTAIGSNGLKSKAGSGRLRSGMVLRRAGMVFGCVLLLAGGVRAEDVSFTNSLARAALAEQRGDVSAALEIYAGAERLAAANSAALCVLTRRYCDLMYLTNAATIQKELVERAQACALQAVAADGKNATAHACLAICYAKSCAFAGLKDELAYTRLFKLEAEKTLALDPRQDIACYLLGRWNYGLANVGLLSRAFVKVVYGGLPKASNEDAIKYFQQAIGLAPNRIIHHAGLAMVYEATGETKLEIAELEKCQVLKPGDHEDADAQQDAEKKLAVLRR